MHQPTATLAPPRLVLGVAAWLAVAFSIAASGALTHVLPLTACCVFATIATGVILYRRDGALRRFADRVDLRVPIALNLVRAVVGVQILRSTAAGTVPALFGHRAGPGDVAVGVLALVALACVRSHPRVVIGWCVLGLLDLALAFSTAQYLIFVTGDLRILRIGTLPWALLPMVIVPTLVLAHLLVIARLRRG